MEVSSWDTSRLLTAVSNILQTAPAPVASQFRSLIEQAITSPAIYKFAETPSFRVFTAEEVANICVQYELGKDDELKQEEENLRKVRGIKNAMSGLKLVRVSKDIFENSFSHKHGVLEYGRIGIDKKAFVDILIPPDCFEENKATIQMEVLCEDAHVIGDGKTEYLWELNQRAQAERAAKKTSLP